MVDMSIVTMVYQTTYNSRGTTLSACLARYYLGESVFLWWFPSFFAGGSSLARLELFFFREGLKEAGGFLPCSLPQKWSPYFWTKPHIIIFGSISHDIRLYSLRTMGYRSNSHRNHDLYSLIFVHDFSWSCFFLLWGCLKIGYPYIHELIIIVPIKIAINWGVYPISDKPNYQL